MKIKWWGHACFSLTFNHGTTLLTDPYNEELPYEEVNEQVDIVTVSHDHFDHNAVNRLPGNPQVVNTINGFSNNQINITGFSTYHDESKGSERGANIIYLMDVEGKKVCHLGDLGHSLSNEKISELAETDILLVPVGGYYTIDAEKAYQIAQQLNPTVVVPMHYKTNILDFPITGVEDFINYFDQKQVKKLNQAQVKIDKLPTSQEVYVLDYVKK